MYLNEGGPIEGGGGYHFLVLPFLQCGVSEVTLKVSNSINMIASTKMKAGDICHVGILKFV